MKKLPLFLILSVFGTACGGDEIQVYRIAKDDAEPMARAPQMPVPHDKGALPEDHPPISGDAMQAPPPSSAPVPKTGAAGMGWTLPSGWTGEGASGMRLATFRYAGTETTVIALGGAAGGDLANANRWRGQIGLPALDEASFQKGSEFVQSGVGRVRVVDYAGPAKRLLGGMVLVDGQTWFFKATGEADAIGEAKPGFLNLLKSLSPRGQ